MTRVILVDNHDSFTWNIAHALHELGASVTVRDVDDCTAAGLRAESPALVVVGPGPRGPRDLPHLLALVDGLLGAVPLFGICLGMQALVRVSDGAVGRARRPVHGAPVAVHHDGHPLFAGLPSPFSAMRYNSLVATRVPPALSIIATDEDGEPAAVAADEQRAWAVQFHPESIGTAGGLVVLANALTAVGGAPRVNHRRGAIPPPAC